VAQKDEEKIEELEQTLFELCGEFGAGRHVPPGVRVLLICAKTPLKTGEICEAVLDRLKEKNAALLERLRPPRRLAHSASSGSDATTTSSNAGESVLRWSSSRVRVWRRSAGEGAAG
jgi:hypothetical protein